MTELSSCLDTHQTVEDIHNQTVEDLNDNIDNETDRKDDTKYLSAMKNDDLKYVPMSQTPTQLRR